MEASKFEVLSESSIKQEMIISNEKGTFNNARKLLQSAAGDDDGSDGNGEGGDANRIGHQCTKNDIVIYQGATLPLPSGIPAYAVQMVNVGVSGCSLYNIHVRCGWFSSARMVNPTVFRRVDYDDCLVNNGGALRPGQSLSFQYANTYQYPLSITSAYCIC
ncbi:hypothetical protein ACFE04_031281 [Oxalis oulophora]